MLGRSLLTEALVFCMLHVFLFSCPNLKGMGRREYANILKADFNFDNGVKFANSKFIIFCWEGKKERKQAMANILLKWNYLKFFNRANKL